MHTRVTHHLFIEGGAKQWRGVSIGWFTQSILEKSKEMNV